MNNYWASKSVQIGTVRESSTHKLKFLGLPGIPDVKEIITSCGCTKAKYDSGTRELSVTYKAGKVPNQVQGAQIVNKSITVIYIDGTQDVLWINGAKIK